MPRRPRLDCPGSWHHVVNRAIAKRPYFEDRREKRYFLARLAAEVRAGRLELHAYSLMTTHFHLLVRSPVGELSDSLRRIQNAYSRYFNRRHRRDGPLIRSRFFSKRVSSDAYRRAVVRYIDANAVRAGMAATSSDYEFGSARAFVLGKGRPWLSTTWVAKRALELTGARKFDGEVYLRAFAPRGPECARATADLVESRMASARDVDPLDDLIGCTPLQVREWMARKANLADGMEIGLPVCGPSAVTKAVAEDLRERGDWVVERSGYAWRGSELAQAGLLRSLSSSSFGEVRKLMGLGVSAASRRAQVHRELMAQDGAYAARISKIASAAIASVGLSLPPIR